MLLIAGACVLSESALTFVMPTFAEHATSQGLASSPAAVGAYFAANALAYTVAAPLVGLVSSRRNSRVLIVVGMCTPRRRAEPPPAAQPSEPPTATSHQRATARTDLPERATAGDASQPSCRWRHATSEPPPAAARAV